METIPRTNVVSEHLRQYLESDWFTLHVGNVSSFHRIETITNVLNVLSR